MTGETCVLCGNTRKKQPQLSYHRLPAHPVKRALWLKEFKLSEDQLKSHSRICSRHFHGGDPRNGPEVSIGKRFASPMKEDAPRTKRANLRQIEKDFQESMASCSRRSIIPKSPAFVELTFFSPMSSVASTPPPPEPPMTAQVEEQLDTDYSVHELPTSPIATTPVPSAADRNRPLLACIELLEAENAKLRKSMPNKEQSFVLNK